MFSPDGTVITASAAPHWGGGDTSNKIIFDFHSVSLSLQKLLDVLDARVRKPAVYASGRHSKACPRACNGVLILSATSTLR